MSEKHVCPSCGSEDLEFGLVYKKWSMMNQVLTIGVGVVSFIGAFFVDSSLLRLACWGLAGIIAWGFFQGWNKDLAAVRFKCADCGHFWDRTAAGKTPDQAGKEIPVAEWKTLTPGHKLPDLE